MEGEVNGKRGDTIERRGLNHSLHRTALMRNIYTQQREGGEDVYVKEKLSQMNGEKEKGDEVIEDK